MKEIYEFRVNNYFAHLLPSNITGKDIGPVTIVTIDRDDTERFEQFKRLNEQVKSTESWSFFYGWSIKRVYSKKELSEASLFHVFFARVFEPAGQECGTIYDLTSACAVCGSNGAQIGSLKLRKGSIPRKDVAETIASEIVVSKRFVDAVTRRGLKGLKFGPVQFSKVESDYRQLSAEPEIELSDKTIAGVEPFDLSTSSGGEIYKCPNGHTIGLNLLSEPHVVNNQNIAEFDFLSSRQKIGVNRGLLRTYPVHFCSQAFRNMVLEEKFTGFEFAVARIDS